MKAGSRILISGAGIAGLVSAYWLARHGMKPVIVEKAPHIRADGFIISLSHESYRFALSMGIMPQLIQFNSQIKESAYINKNGKQMLTLDYDDLFSGIDVIQIMRDDLQMVLYEKVKEMAEIKFGCTIRSLQQEADQVNVEFDDNRSETFDAIIGADGLHSNTRSLAFNPQLVARRYLGLFSSAYRLPNSIGLKSRFENHMEKTRYMCVYTTRDDSLACVFIWKNSDKLAPPVSDRPRILKDAYTDAPEIVQQVLQQCPVNSAIYMDPLIQVELQTWHQDRVVLLGDAAHCLTLLSGQGASSAFWGACVLGQAMTQHSFSNACQLYEKNLMPVIDRVRNQTRAAAKWYVPLSPTRYMLRDMAMTCLPNSFFQYYFKSKYSRA